jgi:DNA-binding NarL/FixJ family response regulator
VGGVGSMHSHEDFSSAYERLGRRVGDDLARLRRLLLDAEDTLAAARADLSDSRAHVSELRRHLNTIRALLADVDAAKAATSNELVADLAKSPALDSLTRRERDVAILLARGLSNRQIADKLVISPATVRVHVEHIFVKLGVHSRTQLAAWIAGEQTRRPPAAKQPETA